MNWAKQVLRGCCNLPHIGSHPGTGLLIFFVIVGGIAGIQSGSVIGSLVGSLIMLIWLGPLYLLGAYDRANISDQIEQKTKNG